MAERVGFEPTIPVKVCPLSRRIVSTAHAPLRVGQLWHFERRSFGYAQDFGSGLPLRSRPLNASTFEADRFNHSRTSPCEKQLLAGKLGANPPNGSRFNDYRRSRLAR